jgi:hypothetical protein
VRWLCAILVAVTIIATTGWIIEADRSEAHPTSSLEQIARRIPAFYLIGSVVKVPEWFGASWLSRSQQRQGYGIASVEVVDVVVGPSTLNPNQLVEVDVQAEACANGVGYPSVAASPTRGQPLTNIGNTLYQMLSITTALGNQIAPSDRSPTLIGGSPMRYAPVMIAYECFRSVAAFEISSSLSPGLFEPSVSIESPVPPAQIGDAGVMLDLVWLK